MSVVCPFVFFSFIFSSLFPYTFPPGSESFLMSIRQHYYIISFCFCLLKDLNLCLGIILRQHKHNPCHFSVSDLNHCSAITVDTAMTGHEASSSSSSKSKLWNYDVFLSFRGEDTRKGFTGHLHAALKDRGYQAYMDEDDLNRGEEIKEELFRAIEGSRISIIVFSKGYAGSSWCLDELVKIMECRSKLRRHVLPIFYHVDPSHVRKQDGDLAKAFQKHKKGISKLKDAKKREAKRERVKQWRNALTEAANLSGHHLQITENGSEADFIRIIVDENICEWLTSTNELHVANYPVGIDSRIQDIITYLSSGGSNDVCMVGIWGMGGVGKTTVAKAIYNQIHPMFQFKSFLADVRDATSKHGLVDLQNKLISDILKKKPEISCVDEGIVMIKQQFRHKRVLVIMDNIDEVEQLDAIVGNHDWFGPGSRIILTTRDEHLLKRGKVHNIYPAQKFNEGEALELFSWHAFGNGCPNEGYHELSKKVVSYCGGLPLALKVLGSFLFERTMAEWKSQLEKLEITPDGKIIKPLRISFDGLDDKQKAIFLDISCFFIGMDKDNVAKALDVCGFSATIEISILRERCLVTVEDKKLNVHDLLREMAKVIISEKSPSHPEKWSRLWNHQEVVDVLRNKSGTEEVEGLALHKPFSHDNSSFNTEAFANMRKLRLLLLYKVELNGEYKHLPKELMWLRWEECLLKSIPDDFFNQPRLVVLEMQRSYLVQVWEGSKSLQNLKIIDLTRSYSLIKSPDFSQVPNLEELILEGCESLYEIDSSIGHLKRLSLVNLRGCRMLTSLPRDFYKSKSVETLCLNDCSEFREVHEDLGEMISLRILEADFTAIRQIPTSIVRLKNLTRLSLINPIFRRGSSLIGVEGIHLPNSLRELSLSVCKLDDDAIKNLGSLISLQYLDLGWNKFHTLPSLSGLSKLETLQLSGCMYLHTIPDLPTNLKVLHVDECPALETMPNFSEMSNIRQLHVSHSPKLTEVPSLDKSLNSMIWIDMHECTNLTADFRKNILQGWTSCGFGGIALHGNYVPNWFDFVNEGTQVSFDFLPTDDHNFEGLTLFCLFRCGKKDLPNLQITVISNTKRTKLQAFKFRGITSMNYEDDYLWQGQLSNNELNLQGGDKVDIVFENQLSKRDNSVKIMRTGVNLVWDKLMKENMHDT
ncbi:disease resistance protein RPV1-like isoform X13 [Malus sylvestris]|uniref:disease resistance protein RPV1-like isoform X13 n=1 Tax=Malus sylvestris TaxID=3752 RepID=UPI0021ACED59|nr:disease resistance protein RPV1-like isoform X13 [Malus sylvestris]